MKKLLLILALVGALFCSNTAQAGYLISLIVDLATQVTGTLSLANGGTCGQGANREATTNATLALTDCGNIVKLNSASAITATIPPNSSVAFPTGANVTIIQSGAGAASLVAGSGVTIRYPSTLNFPGQHAQVVVTKIAADEWMAAGLQ